uniref:Uncharacterized protein n=1 Tax=Babesia bovis TaxID=5865 RepID=S6B085_BABBO|nr:hypothetical protein [Babesia bovis]
MVKSLRPDGRNLYDPRRFKVELNPLRTGPSCRLTVGDSSPNSPVYRDRTSVISLIYFSADNKNRNTVGSYHRPTFEVYIRPAVGPVRGYIRGYECMLLKCMQSIIDGTSLGRVLVSARIQILEDGSGLLATCMNALIISLVVAALPLREIPHAIQFGITKSLESDSVIAEPSSEEIRTQCSTAVTMLCTPNSGSISFVSIDYGRGGYDANVQAQLEALSCKIADARLNYVGNVYREAFEPARISFEANGA